MKLKIGQEVHLRNSPISGVLERIASNGALIVLFPGGCRKAYTPDGTDRPMALYPINNFHKKIAKQNSERLERLLKGNSEVANAQE